MAHWRDGVLAVRRGFANASTACAAALPSFAPLARAERIESSLSVALVGYGRRGEEVVYALTQLPGVRLTAVADIWPLRRQLACERLRALRRPLRAYEALDELLAAEGDKVDAVIVATPDWQHANHVSACLKAGKHVLCEGELADSVEKARELVRLARSAGRLVQGGHQRRSNPRYIHAFERVCRDAQALGRVTHAYAQWHWGASPFYAAPHRFDIPTAKLEAHGYGSMEELQNWEWFRHYGPGGVAARAGQKLDLMRWFWRAEPVSVSAVGSSDFYDRETPDGLMAMFTFRLAPSGECVRGYIQILSANGRGGSYEQFMGENAALTISEVVACGDSVQPEHMRIMMDSERRLELWNPHITAGRILPRREPPKLISKEEVKPAVDARASPNAPGWPLPIRLDKPVIQPHLENFVAAVRDEVVLTDSAEQAYANLVGLDGALRSARERRAVDFASRDFVV